MGSPASPSCDCTDPEYLHYLAAVRSEPAASEARRALARAAEDMYRDLARSRMPKVLAHANYVCMLLCMHVCMYVCMYVCM